MVGGLGTLSAAGLTVDGVGAALDEARPHHLVGGRQALSPSTAVLTALAIKLGAFLIARTLAVRQDSTVQIEPAGRVEPSPTTPAVIAAVFFGYRLAGARRRKREPEGAHGNDSQPASSHA
jgi:hypothetical protein